MGLENVPKRDAGLLAGFNLDWPLRRLNPNSGLV
jgi:hypothetical protein